ncbi:hypothetical protein Q5424_11530 [Conexibacter sp. JD483]|uniref:TolB family protein n=1 Tax=unclassified Conexibacter TaxID=2627773 RepID=UPI002729334D|nr:MULTISPECIES: hypothetical protein [unclassified Conexibacter]MDO8187960.1 hypothetical protein [Conexibacter sp. CPCC 205706]MDO8200171.1 hypothetical protein [Conexibacter sp. CPCC 205762]MDR9369717.1 hypothetical protein [Conexibacter sp. JD483]
MLHPLSRSCSALVAAAAAALLLAPSAQATFPGANGRLGVSYGAGDADDGLTSGLFTGLPFAPANAKRLGWTGEACGDQPFDPAYPDGPSCAAGSGVAFNNSGSVVAFSASTASGSGQLAIAAADATGIALLPPQTASDQQPSFAPTPFGSAASTQLVFQGQSGASGGQTDLYTLTLALAAAPATAAGLTQITRLGDATAPDWSSGNRIVFTHARQLYAIGAGGSGLTRLTSAGGDQAAWSPGGTAVAFARNGAIWRMGVGARGAGTSALRLTSGGGASWPVWSPDGTAIAYERASGNFSSIYTVPARGGRPRLAISGLAFARTTGGSALGPGRIGWQALR